MLCPFLRISYLKGPGSSPPPPGPAWPCLALPGPLLSGQSSFYPHCIAIQRTRTIAAPGSGLRAPGCVMCVRGRDVCGGRGCARSLGSNPEASTKLEMTLVAALSVAGDGLWENGQWTVDIATHNQSIDWPQECDTLTGQEPAPSVCWGWAPARGQLSFGDVPLGSDGRCSARSHSPGLASWHRPEAASDKRADSECRGADTRPLRSEGR